MAEPISRRGFIQAMGAGAGALAVGGALAKTEHVFAAPAQGLVASVAAQANTPNAQTQAVLDELAATNQPPIPSVVPRVARELYGVPDAVRSLLSKQGKPTVEQVGKIAHQVIQGPGGQLLLRMYYPVGNGPFPVLVYFHGGGWVIGTINSYDGSARALTNAAGALVVSVAYRNAPEAPFPGAPMDAITAYKWVLANIASFGGDPNKVAVGGESAGGNLATVTAMMARDQGLKLPIHQLLVYPVTSTFYGTPEVVYPSYEQFTDAMPLNTPMLAWFYKYYLRNAGDAHNPYASPIRGNLAGLPPATVITAEVDPLRDEGEAYKQKLADAGVKVGGMRYNGVTHEAFSMAPVVDVAKQAVMDAATALKQAFGTA